MPEQRSNIEDVSVVIPVLNGARWLDACLRGVLAQRSAFAGRIEIVAVDDGSTDSSPEILGRFAASDGVRVIAGEGRGASAALNLGIAAARFAVIAQVDQDVVPGEGWLDRLLAALGTDSAAAAVQAEYGASADASVWAKVTELDLRQRWAKLHRGAAAPVEVDHVCTGNTVYRKAALLAVGGFDESLGYGYDNDLSYRLVAAGHRLLLCGTARAVHHWPQSLRGFMRQQYGQGYGRLELVARHPLRARGDDVSNLTMVLHAPLMLAALGGIAAALLMVALGQSFWPIALSSLGLISLLAIERFIAGWRAAVAFGDRAGFAFAPVHLLRDVAWSGAIVVRGWRLVTFRRGRPEHSMRELR